MHRTGCAPARRGNISDNNNTMPPAPCARYPPRRRRLLAKPHKSRDMAWAEWRKRGGKAVSCTAVWGMFFSGLLPGGRQARRGARLKGPAGPLRNPGARSGSRRELPPATPWNTVYGARYVHHKIHGHPASRICAPVRSRRPAPGDKVSKPHPRLRRRSHCIMVYIVPPFLPVHPVYYSFFVSCFPSRL